MSDGDDDDDDDDDDDISGKQSNLGLNPVNIPLNSSKFH